MGAGADREARALQPFLKRAEEVERADALVAYYCRLRAAEEGLALEDRAPETTELLGEVLGKLEAAKEVLELEEEADRMHCEGFAMSIFEKADRADRAGAASLGTAKAFYASSVFMEVCRQFGELDADLEAKQKYAVWKASDIRKALKRGERPAPGPPGGEAAAEAQAAAPGPPEAPEPAGSAEAEGAGVGEQQQWGAGEEPSPAPPAGGAAAPEERPDPADALEVDELGLPKAPLQGAPLSPTMGIDVNQFTLPTMPRPDGEEGPPSCVPGGGQDAPPGEPPRSGERARVSGPPPPDPTGAAAAPPPAALPPSAPPAPAPSAPSAPPPAAGRAPAAPPAVARASAPLPPPQPRPGFKPSLSDVMAAKKNARFAVSSLGFEDIPGAVDFLTKALEHLTGGHPA